MPKHTGSANNWTWCEGYEKTLHCQEWSQNPKKEKKFDRSLKFTRNWKLWFDQLFLRLAWAHEVCQLSHLINSQILAVLFALTTHIICQNKHRLMWSLYKHSSSTESRPFGGSLQRVWNCSWVVRHKWLVIPSSCRSPFGLTLMCFLFRQSVFVEFNFVVGVFCDMLTLFARCFTRCGSAPHTLKMTTKQETNKKISTNKIMRLIFSTHLSLTAQHKKGIDIYQRLMRESDMFQNKFHCHLQESIEFVSVHSGFVPGIVFASFCRSSSWTSPFAFTNSVFGFHLFSKTEIVSRWQQTVTVFPL